MSDASDLLIIGGGPAGLAAGIESAKNGLKTTLIERNLQIGPPVNCAEGVTVRSFHRAMEPDPSWIMTHPKIGRLVAPGGRIVEVSDPDGGYLLDRVRMEQDLAERYKSLGGELRLNCRGVALIEDIDRFSELIVENEDGSRERLAAKLFIASDGVESCIARSAGIENYLYPQTTDAYVQYRLKLPRVDPTRIEVHLGTEIAPGAYAWVFPKGETEANVGLGLLGSQAEGREGLCYLDKFVNARFEQYEIIGRSCGTSPRYTGMNDLAVMNLLLTGDAARLVDTLTGGGICTALHSGRIAAEEGIKYLKGETVDPDLMGRAYRNRLIDEYGSELKRLLTLKQFFAKLNDREIDDLVEAVAIALERRAAGNFDLFGLVIEVIKTKPRLISLARHLL